MLGFGSISQFAIGEIGTAFTAPVVVTGHVGGGSETHSFTRKRWREIQEQISEREGIVAAKPESVAAESDAIAAGALAIEALERALAAERKRAAELEEDDALALLLLVA